jgi:hypothetical protein
VFTETLDGSINGRDCPADAPDRSFTSVQNGTVLTTPESPVFDTFGNGTFTNN